MARPTPYDLFLAPIADESFPRIRASLAAAGVDPADRDAFLMDREVVTLIRQLRGDEALGEAMDQMVALVHQTYLAWDAGLILVPLTDEATEAMLRSRRPETPGGGRSRRGPTTPSCPSGWSGPASSKGEPAEPLDGCFVSRVPDADLRVLAIFGLRPDRAGFSAVEVGGPRPGRLARADGSALFAPTLAGRQGRGTPLHHR